MWHLVDESLALHRDAIGRGETTCQTYASSTLIVVSTVKMGGHVPSRSADGDAWVCNSAQPPLLNWKTLFVLVLLQGFPELGYL